MPGKHLTRRTLLPLCAAAFVVVGAWGFVRAAAAAEPLTVMATWGGDEEAGFRHVLDAFTRNTGIGVTYEGSRDVDVVLKTRVAGGNPPDVAILPQYGVIVELARQGLLRPLSGPGPEAMVPRTLLEANYSPAFIALGTLEGAFYALPVKASSKSVIWYKPASLKALGMAPPRTWDGLLAVAAAYLKRGRTPFAIGGADGWPLTDWFENIYVRVAGPARYRKLFLTHQVPWTDPTVREAMARLKEIVRPERMLAGGAEGTLSTGFIDAFNAVLRPHPAAELYFEGGFMGAFAAQNFPKLRAGRDYAFFPFPAIDPAWGRPVVGGGDLLVAFNGRPAVRRLVRYLAGKEAATRWASAEKGAILSPNRAVPRSVYAGLRGAEARQLLDADAFVFDGSDMAPSAVGGDALVIALQDFVAEPERVDEILETLEAAAARAY